MAAKRYLAPWRRAAAAARALEGGGGRPPDPEALAALEGKPALYHCVSRVVWRELVLGEAEKEQFVRSLRKWEAFSRVRVLAFCVMTNHFHLLVEVPERPAEEPPDGELLEHLGLIYGGRRLAQIRWELEQHRGQGNHAAAEALRRRFLRRMWDLSAFMKDLKQELSHWFNKRHGKRGHLWEERFRSVLVEDGHAARMVSAYIDLNPVRAGMVGRPEQYRWSGYGEAAAGGGRALEGIAQVMLERELARSGVGAAVAEVSDRRRCLAGYRAILGEALGRPERAPEGEAGGRADGGGGKGRRMREAELLGRRLRYFTDGLVVGSRAFVDGVFGLSAGCFGARRSSGARRFAGAETSLRAMRALRVRPYG